MGKSGRDRISILMTLKCRVIEDEKDVVNMDDKDDDDE